MAQTDVKVPSGSQEVEAKAESNAKEETTKKISEATGSEAKEDSAEAEQTKAEEIKIKINKRL